MSVEFPVDSCGLITGQWVFPGCGFTYLTEAARATECPASVWDAWSKLVLDKDDSCGLLSRQPVFPGCGNTYLSEMERYVQCPDASDGYYSILVLDSWVPSERNMALGKQATMSSSANPDASWPAGNAVDGDIYTYSSTDYQENPWWQVDLGESIRINEVYLHDRQDCCRTLGGSFKIMLLDAEQVLVDEMNVNGIAREGSFTFDDVLARYVKIERVYWNGRISLSEVEVYGSEQVTPGSLGDGL